MKFPIHSGALWWRGLWFGIVMVATTANAARVDPAFVASNANLDEPMSVRVFEAPNGDVILFGGFNVIADLPVELLAKVRADGSIDRSYTAENLPGGGNNTQYPDFLEMLPNGVTYMSRTEYLPGTEFVRTYLRRTDVAGLLDDSFGVPCIASDLACHVLPDGKLIVAGAITTVNEIATVDVVRLMADGTIDETFQAPETLRRPRLLVDGQGRLIAVSREGGNVVVRRLLPDGGIDNSFTPAVVDANDCEFSLFPDGSVFVFGSFISVNGENRGGYARIDTNGNLAGNFLGSITSNFEILSARVFTDGRVIYVARNRYLSEMVIGTVPADGGSGAQVTVSLVAFATLDLACHITQSGKILMTGRGMYELAGQRVHCMARLNADGTLDPSFPSRMGRSGAVRQIHPLPGGRTLIVGSFTLVGGEFRNNLAMVDSSGAVVSDFLPDLGEGGHASSAHVVADGSFLITGTFRDPGGSANTSSFRTIRLMADGTRDPTFEARYPYGSWPVPTENTEVIYLVVQPSSTSSSLVVRRLHQDLSEDPGFNAPEMNNVRRIIRMPDNRLFVWSAVFTGGSTFNSLLMLQANGQQDASFTTSQIQGETVLDVALAPGGKIVVGGTFDVVHGLTRNKIVRLNGNGTVDMTFNPPSFSDSQGEVGAVLVQPDGKVIVGGRYWAFDGVQKSNAVVARLNQDGSMDTPYYFVSQSFSEKGIHDLAFSADNDILVAGHFWEFGGEPHAALARITELAFHAQVDPTRLQIAPGSTGLLQASAVGVEPTAYQWLRNGQSIAGANRAMLALRDFSGNEAGEYQVRITAGNETHTSPSTPVSISDATTVRALGPMAFSRDGGFGSIRIDVPAGTNWSTSGVPSWVHVQPGSTTGSRTLAFTLAPNDTGAMRSAGFEVAGQSFQVQQRATRSRLANISTRGVAGAGSDSLIVGFYTAGSQPIDVLARAAGPSLIPFGLNDVLPDPVLNLMSGATSISESRNWETEASRDLIISEGLRVGAFPLTTGAGEAALIPNLGAGGYTALITDSAGRSGVALAELYDLTSDESTNATQRLANLSTRGRVGTGDNVLIAGFVILGSSPKQVLIRGVGPGLAPFGVTGVLADPVIRLMKSGQILLENNDWGFTADSYLVAAAAYQSWAFDVDVDGRDAALVTTLSPGQYTVIVSGTNNDEGVGLVEIYDLDYVALRD